MTEIIHYTDPKNKKYPKALCGVCSLKTKIIQNISKCNCKMCLKAHASYQMKNKIRAEKEFNKVNDRKLKIT